MGGKTGTTIALIALGIGAIYLGASGNLASFWTGLRGGYSPDEKSTTQGDTIQDGNGNTVPANNASPTTRDNGQTNAGGAAQWQNSNSALLQGGEARPRSGQYYSGPNGMLFVSDGGTY